MEIQDIIKQRRSMLGLTLKDVAAALNVSEGTVSRYESGEIQNMGIDKIEDLARVLQCSPGYLMGWEDSTSLVLSTAEEHLIHAFRIAEKITQDHVRLLLGINSEVSSGGTC